jgi:hypothetical protein
MPHQQKTARWAVFRFEDVANWKGLRGLDVADRELAGAAVFLDVERDLLALHQTAHSSALERGGMNENVFAAVIRLDEAEAFLVVIKLYDAGIHEVSFADPGALDPSTHARA